jgi:hypothetical protein
MGATNFYWVMGSHRWDFFSCHLFILFLLKIIFETGSGNVAQAGLNLRILLP